jgi:ATP-dependent DNA ligase
MYAFDLIELDGDDLRREPLEVRKATLASVVVKVGHGMLKARARRFGVCDPWQKAAMRSCVTEGCDHGSGAITRIRTLKKAQPAAR